MLVLSRKKEEEIFIETPSGKIIIKIVDIDDRNVRVGIDAPRNLVIYRKEVYEKVNAENTASSTPPDKPSIESALKVIKHEDQ